MSAPRNFVSGKMLLRLSFAQTVPPRPCTWHLGESSRVHRLISVPQVHSAIQLPWMLIGAWVKSAEGSDTSVIAVNALPRAFRGRRHCQWIIHHFNSCYCWNLPPVIGGGLGLYWPSFPAVTTTSTTHGSVPHAHWKSNLHPRNPLESKVYLFGFAICSALLFCCCLLLELLQLMFNRHL